LVIRHESGVGSEEVEGFADVGVAGIGLDVEGDLGGAGVVLFLPNEGEGELVFLAWGEFEGGFEAHEEEAPWGVFEGDLEGEGLVALVDEAQFPRVDDGLFVFEEGGISDAGASELGRDGPCVLEGRDTEEGAAEEEDERVDDEAGAEEAGFPAGEAVEGIVSDESARAAHPVHDGVAGVDAGGASDALQLQAVADVDTGRADIDAAPAVDAVGRFGVGWFAAGFAASFVVADVDGVVVGEGRLEAAVRAHDDAELLAKPCEAEIEDGGEESHHPEGPDMVEGAAAHHSPEAFERDEIRQEDVRDDQRDDEVEEPFRAAPQDLVAVPRGAVESPPGRAVAFEPELDATVDVIEEDRVGAGPAAPQAAEKRRHEKEGEAEPGDQKEQNPKVLGREGETEEINLRFRTSRKTAGAPLIRIHGRAA